MSSRPWCAGRARREALITDVRPRPEQKEWVEGKATVVPVRVVIGEIKVSIGSPTLQGLAQSGEKK